MSLHEADFGDALFDKVLAVHVGVLSRGRPARGLAIVGDHLSDGGTLHLVDQPLDPPRGDADSRAPGGRAARARLHRRVGQDRAARGGDDRGRRGQDGVDTGVAFRPADDDLAGYVVWSCEEPLREAAAVRGLVAFFDERVDVVLDGERRERRQTQWSKGMLEEAGV